MSPTGLILGQSTGGLILGQSKLSLTGRTVTHRTASGRTVTRTYRAPETGKASSMSQLKGELIRTAGTVGRVGLSLGTAGWVAVETYKALTKERPETGGVSLIRKGAQEFGGGYGESLPHGYQKGQEQTYKDRMSLYEMEQLERARIDQKVYEYSKSIELPKPTDTQKATAKTAYIPTIL